MTRERRRVLLASACVLDDQDRVLLVRRHEPGLPQLDGNLELPGGKLEPQERSADAAAREVYEETGIRVLAQRMLGTPYEASRAYVDMDLDVFIICYLCEWQAAPPSPAHRLPTKIGEVTWLPVLDVNPLELQPASLQFLAAFVREHRFGQTARRCGARLSLRSPNGEHDYGLNVEASLSDDPPLRLTRTWGRVGGPRSQETEQLDGLDDLRRVIDRIVRDREERYFVVHRDRLFPATAAVQRLGSADSGDPASLFVLP